MKRPRGHHDLITRRNKFRPLFYFNNFSFVYSANISNCAKSLLKERNEFFKKETNFVNTQINVILQGVEKDSKLSDIRSFKQFLKIAPEKAKTIRYKFIKHIKYLESYKKGLEIWREKIEKGWQIKTLQNKIDKIAMDMYDNRLKPNLDEFSKYIREYIENISEYKEACNKAVSIMQQLPKEVVLKNDNQKTNPSLI